VLSFLKHVAILHGELGVCNSSLRSVYILTRQIQRCMHGLLDGRWGAWLRLAYERLTALRRYSAATGRAD